MTLNAARFFPEGMRRWAVTHVGLAVLLLLSLTLNGLLIWRALYWQHRAQDRIAGQRSDPLAAMTVLPALRGKHPDGSEAVVDFTKSGKPTLLYLMSPHCGWCARNLGNFKALVQQGRNRYRLVAVSVTAEGLAEYVSANHWTPSDLEVVFDVPESVLQAEDLMATPQTLLVSPEGKLVRRWQGAYTDNQGEVEKALGVRLPGLAD
jgi:hypothetical protein